MIAKTRQTGEFCGATFEENRGVIDSVSLAGGKGTMLGVLFGTLIIGVVDNGLSVMGVGPAYQAIAKGAIIIVAVGLDSLRRSSRR